MDAVRVVEAVNSGKSTDAQNIVPVALQSFMEASAKDVDLADSLKSFFEERKFKNGLFGFEQVRDTIRGLGIQISDEETAEFMVHYGGDPSDHGGDRAPVVGFDCNQFVTMLTASMRR